MTRRRVDVPPQDSVLDELYGSSPPAAERETEREPEAPAEAVASRAPARVRARAREQAPARAGGQARKRTGERASGQAPEQAGTDTGGQAGAAALAPAAEQPAGWPYEDRRAWELRARAYAAALSRTRARGVELAEASRGALDRGATPADLAAALRDATLGAGDVPPDVARAAGLE